MHRVALRRLAALLLTPVVLTGMAVPATAVPTGLPESRAAVLDWLEAELAADGGALSTAYDDGAGGVATFADWGLTIDAVLALAAGGRGGTPSATTAASLVEAHVGDYVTGGAFGPDDRYAGALGKALLMAQVAQVDAVDFGGFDLEAELRARRQPSGVDGGRFSDLTGYGDFSNGFGQALAVMALARTAGGVPADAVAFLLAQQCPGGGFRGDYTASGGCTADAAATVDATGFALQALVSVTPTCATRRAVTAAAAALVAGQTPSGAFAGESGSNTNSTGLAAVALRSLGQVAAADSAAAFVSGLQLVDGADAGSLALNAATFASAADGVQVLERDGFRRASTQGVLALGLRSYAEIGTDAVDAGAFAPCAEPAPPSPTAATGSLSAATVAPGGQLTVTGAGFLPGEPVTATLRSAVVDLGTLTADAGGAVALTFTVPATIEPGVHTVVLAGATSGRTVSLPFEVVATAAPGTLPATGATTGALGALGATLVAVGAALVTLGGHRRGAPS